MSRHVNSWIHQALEYDCMSTKHLMTALIVPTANSMMSQDNGWLSVCWSQRRDLTNHAIIRLRLMVNQQIDGWGYVTIDDHSSTRLSITSRSIGGELTDHWEETDHCLAFKDDTLDVFSIMEESFTNTSKNKGNERLVTSFVSWNRLSSPAWFLVLEERFLTASCMESQRRDVAPETTRVNVKTCCGWWLSFH